MLSLTVLIVIVVAGWFDWSYWWAIPLGYALFAATFYGRADEALKHKHSAWLMAPLLALLFMWIGHTAQNLMA